MLHIRLRNLSCLVIALVIASLARAGDTRCDVVVYGGTAAGVTAAIAAARDGASVTLIEPGKHLGGMVSGGLGATDIGNTKTIGGITREFFDGLGKKYGQQTPAWKHEPHVAEQVFGELIQGERSRIRVILSERLVEKVGVSKQGGRIASIACESGNNYAANVFVDASYEGDLMAQAGVKYTVGREGVSEYGESRAGIRPIVPFKHPGSARDGQGLLPDISDQALGKDGEADRKIMAYTFRVCMTRDAANRRDFEKPDTYDPRRYAPLLVMLSKKPQAVLEDCMRLNELPNGKTDTNNKAGIVCSTNLHNGSWQYPDGSYAKRAEIWKDHENYVRGLLYFVASNPGVPQGLREEASQWGLAKDEFADNNNWPYQLYVRVGRRMVGAHVMTEQDLAEIHTQRDSVAMGSYPMDSHRVQRIVLPDGDIGTEGGVGGSTGPYEIAYRSLTPKREQCENLLVPVCMSASSVAYCSIRMEPVFMMMGHSAGTAAAMASQAKTAVQDVAYPKLREKLLAEKQVLALAVPAKAKKAEPAAAKIAPESAPQTQPALIGMRGQPPEFGKVDPFFPCFDKYGQYVHRDWPGKIHNDAELKATLEAEAKDLTAHPGPADWDRFGGWKAGPTLKSTGHFRTEKIDGRWWLIDPEGRLFFSNGFNCVRKFDPTPVEERDNWFIDLPTSDPAFTEFFNETKAVKAHYAGRDVRSFLFNWANLMRKFGSDWDRASGEFAHQRLRSWGFNTMGNWSHEPTYLMHKTPYTVNLGFLSKPLSGATQGFRDAFDPSFAEALAKRVQEERGKSIDDPMCLGYFVDNELPWGKEHSLGEATLKSGPAQPAKLAMVEDLKTKYGSIEKLNTAWETTYAFWQSVLDSTTAPTNERALEDEKLFHARFADVYYSTARKVLKQHAPNMLYLGSRIHIPNLPARDAAAKYCDIVSYNVYKKDVSVYPEDRADVPIMITEWAFGAIDRGMYHGGLVTVQTQAERAAAYEKFMASALARPNIVGCHWFQYQDQPASGRSREGENGEYGFVDLVDTPYAEMVAASRAIADRIYVNRIKSIGASAASKSPAGGRS